MPLKSSQSPPEPFMTCRAQAGTALPPRNKLVSFLDSESLTHWKYQWKRHLASHTDQISISSSSSSPSVKASGQAGDVEDKRIRTTRYFIFRDPKVEASIGAAPRPTFSIPSG
ncbi:hypothetical protein E2C01_044313 [Portunus trituberculatus]|uniref:Uncharacterized protein n=1 Tax=Portunus trituberculatus TaxID=210409 RepID=A0A5B7G1Y2_PORTR|nr:hypothetical protein [Portunus trituberculatus]